MGVPVLTVVGWMCASAPSTHAQVLEMPSDKVERARQQAIEASRNPTPYYPSTMSPTQKQQTSPLSYADPFAPNTNPNTVMRPVVETTYVDQTYTTSEPVTDRSTGEVTLKNVTKTRQVPVQTTRWVTEQIPAYGQSRHEPKVYQIIAELRGLEVTDTDKDAVKKKQQELHELLESEFDKKH